MKGQLFEIDVFVAAAILLGGIILLANVASLEEAGQIEDEHMEDFLTVLEEVNMKNIDTSEDLAGRQNVSIGRQVMISIFDENETEECN